MDDYFNIINSNDNFQIKIKSILNLKEISNKLKIEFALFCAQDCFKYIDGAKYPELKEKSTKCLELVADFLLGKKVSNKELNAAASEKYYNYLIQLLKDNKIITQTDRLLYG